MTDALGDATLQKEEQLKGLLAGYGRVLVAYSGGVDSTYLAAVAHEMLTEEAHLLIVDSPTMPRSELAEAKAIAAYRGWNVAVVETAEFQNEAFLRNDAKRCYHCKAERFDFMRAYAEQRDIAVIAHGENVDDTGDPTRVGAQAAKERSIAAPLQEVDLTKGEIRQLSRRRGLPTWNKNSSACLATRIPTDTRLDVGDLAKVEQAEETLKRLGFRQYRVRHHDRLARIEIDPEDFALVLRPNVRNTILDEFAHDGYSHVTLDLAGYRSKSLLLPQEPAEDRHGFAQGHQDAHDEGQHKA